MISGKYKVTTIMTLYSWQHNICYICNPIGRKTANEFKNACARQILASFDKHKNVAFVDLTRNHDTCSNFYLQINCIIKQSDKL